MGTWFWNFALYIVGAYIFLTFVVYHLLAEKLGKKISTFMAMCLGGLIISLVGSTIWRLNMEAVRFVEGPQFLLLGVVNLPVLILGTVLLLTVHYIVKEFWMVIQVWRNGTRSF